MQRGRRIAFDYGDVRIGVAVCDPDGIICTPLTALKTQDPDLDSKLISLFDEYEPIYIALGEPRHLSGSGSAKMELVAAFAQDLQALRDIEIRYIDERFSTVNAASKLRASGRDARASKEFIDSAAAAEILESALASDRAKDQRE